MEPVPASAAGTPETNDDLLAPALALAVRAPSLHNTQPWRWRIAPGRIELHADRGRRLDHIWVTPALADMPRSMQVLKEARGWERASDHVPVVASLAL